MKSATLRLRNIQPTDERYFARWWRQPKITHLTSGDMRHLTDEKIHEYFHQIVYSTSAKHWMVTRNGVPMGHVTVRGQQPAEIQIMIGDPKYWSRGYGTEIVQHLQPVLARRNITWARMYVWRQNKRSIGLGKKFGFRLVGRVRRRVGSRTRMYLKLDWRRPANPD